MNSANTLVDVKRFMKHASYNLANASLDNDPKLLWAVLMNTQVTIHSYITALETEMKTNEKG
jgi:hypothetical protein